MSLSFYFWVLGTVGLDEDIHYIFYILPELAQYLFANRSNPTR